MIKRSYPPLLVLFVLIAFLVPVAAGDSFPFGTTLMLDAAPLRGSKRIPMLEIAENGAASIDLWCASARAQAVVADHSITIATGDLQNAQCDSDRQSRDAELLAALAQVTNWRRNGEVVELLGATPAALSLTHQLGRFVFAGQHGALAETVANVKLLDRDKHDHRNRPGKDH